MKKHLTENEISLAREIFVSLAVQHKTQDFNKQMASASICLARIFSEAVEDENADCENFKFDPVGYDVVKSNLLQPSEEVKQHLHAKYFGFDVGESDSHTPVNPIPRFNKMACCYEKFDIFGPLHKAKYEKNEIIPCTETCRFWNIDNEKEVYLDHAYPSWVVAKFTDAIGVVWGASSDKFTFVDGLGIWVADNPSPQLKLAVLMYEKCTVEPKDSLVSIDLPF